jgi:hypothetical protein
MPTQYYGGLVEVQGVLWDQLGSHQVFRKRFNLGFRIRTQANHAIFQKDSNLSVPQILSDYQEYEVIITSLTAKVIVDAYLVSDPSTLRFDHLVLRHGYFQSFQPCGIELFLLH